MIDVDNPSTWPDCVRAWVEPLAEKLRGTTGYTSDLDVPLEADDAFMGLLVGETLLASHFTRLLDHEVEQVRHEGLKPLTHDFLARRIDDAYAHRGINQETKALLLSANLLARGHRSSRENKVCFVLGHRALNSSAVGCDDQLARWGGEGIFRSSPAIADRVRGIGQPAMVVAEIGVSREEVILAAPPLSRLFVGSLLCTQPPYGEVHLAGGVPATNIVGVYRPGDSDYDRYAGLPRN